MNGYKIFNSDWTCRGFQYKVGESYEMKSKPCICVRGFHFCTNLLDCFNYYDFNLENKIAEVEAYGDLDTSKEDSKHCTNKIRIIREIAWKEIPDIINIKKSYPDIKEVMLLSKEEYSKFKENIPKISCWWWLRSPGCYRSYAALVVDTCVVLPNDCYDYYTFSALGCVRPALIGDFKSSHFQVKDKFWYKNYIWTVISDDIAICDICVGRTYFDTIDNNYETSNIKKWVDNWAVKNGIITT